MALGLSEACCESKFVILKDMSTKRPKVGLGVIIIRDDTVLMGKRKNAHESGTWSFPGGHIEWNESIVECAKREVLEETGLEITDLRYGPYTNDIFAAEQKHYITVFVLAHSRAGEPKIMEPDKCGEWKWFQWHELPSPLFLPTINLLQQHFSPFVWVGSRLD